MSDIGGLVKDLVLANRILFAQGVVDAMGHVSVRHPLHPDRFFIARAIAPSTVTEADILEIDLSGSVVGPGNGTPYLERFIHSEIYRHRQDAVSVVHSHSPSVIPFGVTDTRLQAIFHMASFLGLDVPVFEIRDNAGDCTDLLIRSPALGAALAQSMNESCAVLQRGHGSTIYGRSLREAVFRAVYLEVNAGLQAAAMRMGTVKYLSQGEAIAATETNGGVSVSRAWDMWVSMLPRH